MGAGRAGEGIAAQEVAMDKRLYRSRDERMIWGICGGMGKYFDVDPTLVRVIWVLTLFLGGAGILVYIILAIIVPLEPGQDATGS